MISPNLEKKRSTKGRHISSRMHTEMDIQEPSQQSNFPCVASQVIQRKITLTV